MSRRARLAAVLVALLLPSLALTRWTQITSLRRAAVDPPPFPLQVGEWERLTDEALEPDVVRLIQPDGYLLRSYAAPGRAPVWLYVGFYAGRGGFGGNAHDPEVCYPAQGWEVMDTRRIEIDVGDAQRMQATLLRVQRESAREAVIYWHQPAGRWPRTGGVEQLLRLVDAARGQLQHAFVRLSAPIEASEVEVLEDLHSFARTAAPALREMVETNVIASGASAPGPTLASAQRSSR